MGGRVELRVAALACAVLYRLALFSEVGVLGFGNRRRRALREVQGHVVAALLPERHPQRGALLATDVWIAMHATAVFSAAGLSQLIFKRLVGEPLLTSGRNSAPRNIARDIDFTLWPRMRPTARAFVYAALDGGAIVGLGALTTVLARARVALVGVNVAVGIPVRVTHHHERRSRALEPWSARA